MNTKVLKQEVLLFEGIGFVLVLAELARKRSGIGGRPRPRGGHTLMDTPRTGEDSLPGGIHTSLHVL